jgi:hypothetical protein
MSRLTAVFLIIVGLVVASFLGENARADRHCEHRWHRTTPYGEMGYCPAEDGRPIYGPASTMAP